MAGEATRIAKGLHKYERQIVPHLASIGSLAALAKTSGLQEVEAMRALQWLEGKGCVEISTAEKETVKILAKGQAAKKEGLPERHVLQILMKERELPVEKIKEHLPAWDKEAAGPITGWLKRMKLPFVTDAKGRPAFKWIDGIQIPVSEAEKLLAAAASNNWSVAYHEWKAGADELLRRQGYATLEKRKEKGYKLTPLGIALTKEALGEAGEERLTGKMLESGKWGSFRPYNVEINVPRASGGRIHFVNEAITYIKRIWLDMGFEEMAGNHVQTAFWDLDALFVPQDHPAREMQDTFYIEKPASGLLPADMWKKVKAVHEDGGDTGSLGWRTTYSEAEAKRNLLRTHTTVLSAQMLDMIRRGKKQMPGKYFSVNKVYRNEALDWKHLFEFHQVEGIVVAEEMTLSHLKGYLREFFGKMGFPDVRIRPAHFPYTEPSAEVEVFDPKKKQWVELGGCGIFRPEVTKTLIGKEVPVLAWGLGMERIIKEYYCFEDLRDLYRNDLEQLKSVKAWLR